MVAPTVVKSEDSSKLSKFTVVKQEKVGLWDRFSVSPIPYYFCFSIPLIQILVLQYYGSFWGVTWLAFALIPALDTVFPVDLSDPSETNPTWNDSLGKLLYKLPLYVWPAISTWQLLWACNLLATKSELLSWIDVFGLAMTVSSYSGGMGFMVAHELLHKPSKFEKFLSYWILTLTSYMHFVDEHQFGHHKWVATPVDAATARFGQSFYNFVPQTVIGSWKSAWEMNAQNMKSKKQKIWSVQNQMLWFLAIPALFAISLSVYYSTWKVIPFFYLQAVIGFMYLEVVNYIEHYGLERAKLENGNYEPVNITHSWNAPHRISNYFLFKLQRHSDHHAHAMRPYEILRNFMESPQLPSGYPAIMILSLFPSMFFSVMDPVIKMYRQDKTNGLKFTKVIQQKANAIVLVICATVTVMIFGFTGNSPAAAYA